MEDRNCQYCLYYNDGEYDAFICTGTDCPELPCERFAEFYDEMVDDITARVGVLKDYVEMSMAGLLMADGLLDTLTYVQEKLQRTKGEANE